LFSTLRATATAPRLYSRKSVGWEVHDVDHADHGALDTPHGAGKTAITALL
jgi:hypothetical protein